MRSYRFEKNSANYERLSRHPHHAEIQTETLVRQEAGEIQPVRVRPR